MRELAPSVQRRLEKWLKDQVQSRTYVRVPMRAPQSAGRPDGCGLYWTDYGEPRLIVIEAKTNRPELGIYQAMRYKTFAHQVYLFTQSDLVFYDYVRESAEHNGIGILFIGTRKRPGYPSLNYTKVTLIQSAEIGSPLEYPLYEEIVQINFNLVHCRICRSWCSMSEAFQQARPVQRLIRKRGKRLEWEDQPRMIVCRICKDNLLKKVFRLQPLRYKQA